MKSALLLRIGGLGDLMVVFPSIYLLRKVYRDYSLTLVCRKEYGLILKETGVVDSIVSVDERGILPLFRSPPYSEKSNQWLGNFSLILGWMQKEFNHSLKEHSSLEQKKCHFFIHDTRYKGTLSKFFFEKTLESLGDRETPSPSFTDCKLLPLSPSQRQEGLMLLGEKALKERKKNIVVHPGSGSKSKCWPLDNFLHIIHMLSLKGFTGALVTGMAETQMENKLKSTSLPCGWVWLHTPSILMLSGLLSKAVLYIGNDSGITHLAAACGTDVVALFQKDLVSLWKPYGRVFILIGESVSEVRIDSVWDTIMSIL